MMFKTVLFGGFLLATVCATTDKPRMASLEVQPNLDQSLTYKDFRVHYSGAGGSISSSGKTVSIKIYEKGEGEDKELFTFDVDRAEVDKPKAYYFGYENAKAGAYEVDVCVENECAGKSPALTNIKKDEFKNAVTCVKGKEEGEGEAKKWTETRTFQLDVLGADRLLTKDDIEAFKTSMPTYKSEWKKHDIQSNPSYLESAKVFYAAVLFDIAYYRDLFLGKGKEDGAEEYTHEFCERKYLLSSHVHLVKKTTHEVKYRFKKTLYMSPGAKQAFVIKNTGAPDSRRKIPVELAFENVTLEKGEYKVWISFCATEKDENDSTVCSNPFIHSEDLSVSGSE